MAFPVVAAEVGSTEATDTASHDVPIPTGTTGLLLGVSCINGIPTLTPPTGWTAFLDQQNGAASTKAFAFYRWADGTESATTYSSGAASEESATRVFRITGAHGTSPPEVSFVGATAVLNNPPSLTPTWGADDTLWIAGFAYLNPANLDVTSAPTNYTDLSSDESPGAATGAGLATARRQNNTATEDPDSFGQSVNRAHVTLTIGIRPGGDTTPPAVPSGWSATIL